MGAIESQDKNTNVEGILVGTPVMDGIDLVDITPVAGTTDGEWIGPLKSWDKSSIGLYASAAAQFLICGSNLVAKPANSYDGDPLFYGQSTILNSVASLEAATGKTIFTGAGEAILAVKIQVRWLKVKVPTNAAALVSASLIGV